MSHSSTGTGSHPGARFALCDSQAQSSCVPQGARNATNICRTQIKLRTTGRATNICRTQIKLRTTGNRQFDEYLSDANGLCRVIRIVAALFILGAALNNLPMEVTHVPT